MTGIVLCLSALLPISQRPGLAVGIDRQELQIATIGPVGPQMGGDG